MESGKVLKLPFGLFADESSFLIYINKNSFALMMVVAVDGCVRVRFACAGLLYRPVFAIDKCSMFPSFDHSEITNSA